VEAFSALIDPRDSNKVSEALERALAGQSEYHVEFRPLRPDRQPRWLETSGRVTFDGQGKPVLMHGAVIDTTSRRAAEEVQREIERQLMLLIEASGALLASPHSSEVLSTITDLARRFVSADAHAVWRKHDDNVWRLRSSTGLSGEYLKTGFLNAAGASSLPTGPMRFEDVAAEPLLEQRHEALAREGIRSMLAIPLRIHGEPSGTVVFYWKSVHKFRDSEVRIAAALGNLAASALGTAELYDRQLELRGEAQAAERRAAFLAETGAILSSSLDFDVTLTSVAKLAVPVFADWASVDILDQNSEVRRIAVAHSDPEKVRFAQELAERYPPPEDDPAMIAMRNGTSLIIEEVSDQLIAERARDEEHLRIIRELALKSAIIAPIVAGQRSLGVITFVTAESGRHYTSADLQTAEELARRAGTALENARLYSNRRMPRLNLNKETSSFAAQMRTLTSSPTRPHMISKSPSGWSQYTASS
jgi:GAF domain-containing protein